MATILEEGSIYCNKCERDLMHEVIEIEEWKEREASPPDFVEFITRYHALRCRACGTVCFRRRVWCSEDQFPPDDFVFRYEYFPPRHKRPIPKWSDGLAEFLRQLVGEIALATAHGCYVVAALGARAALDEACVVVLGEESRPWDFKEKKKGLQGKGIIGDDDSLDVKMFNSVAEIGHGAAHRAHALSETDLFAQLDALEHLLKKILIDDVHSAKIAKAVEAASANVPRQARRLRPVK